MPGELQRQMGVVGGAHDFVEFFTGADADLADRQLRCHGAGQVHDADRGQLGHEDFAALHAPEVVQHEVHALLQGDPETRHPLVGDRQVRAALGDQLVEEGHDRAARTCHIAVAHDGKARAAGADHVVGSDKQLVRGQLGGAVQVDRIGGLVGGQGNDAVDVVLDGTPDHVLGAMDVGLDALHRVVLGRRHLLEGCGVDHDVHAVHGLRQAFLVAHVTDEVAHAGRVEFLRHLVLLELVAREDHDARRLVALQQGFDVLLAEGTGAPGDQNGFLVEHEPASWVSSPDNIR